MPQIIPFIPLIASVAGPLMGKLLGGGSEESSGGGGGGGGGTGNTAAPKKLFNPAQIQQATDKYTSTGTAKWNQILANMGAGGGTGGPAIETQIGSQAQALSQALGGLTTDSGYGDNPMSALDQILKNVEGGINPKYAVY